MCKTQKNFCRGKDFTMTSAEPSRTAFYSFDFSWRVVWQRIGMGLTYKEIAIRYQIAVSTAQLTDCFKGMNPLVMLLS